MKKYYNQLNKEIKEYFKILSKDYPEWLEDYINTKEMQRISTISMSCGMDYTKCFNIKYWYSNLDHSVGVALIIWNFTHDKKQTLAGLFHDISTPVFKHCIDFMNGDSEHQESTEEKTTSIIENSKEIMTLLKRDNIKLEEINDYKIYPLADNEIPKLSSDRFEYTFSSGLTFFRIWELDQIKEIYEDITIIKNEYGYDELAFKHKKICDKYIEIIKNIWPQWISDNDKICMQFLADMCKSLNKINKLTIDDLYNLSELEVIKIFENNQDKYLEEVWHKFSKTDKSYRSNTKVPDKYCINVNTKTRYINPLVVTKKGIKRIYDISPKAKKAIDEYLELQRNNHYIYFDFDFHPYE